MSNYTQTTNFATKDALASGNPLKVVKGTEINVEFANIATAVATKADTVSPTFTGTVTIPTLAVTGTSTIPTLAVTGTSTISTLAVTGTSTMTGAVSVGTTLGVTGVTTVQAGTAALPAITTTGDTNTGIFFPAADTIAFSEGGVEAMRIDSSGNLLFNSGYGSVATAFGVRAWVNFNGTGTVAIRGSGNVTSITDNGTGDYTVNFTTAMPDANYSTVGTTGSPAAAHGIVTFFAGTGTATTTSTIRFATVTANGSSTQFDYVNVCLAVFR